MGGTVYAQRGGLAWHAIGCTVFTMPADLPNVFHGIATDPRDRSKTYCRIALYPADCGSGWQVTTTVTACNGSTQSKDAFPAPVAYHAAVARYVEAERLRKSIGFRRDTALSRHPIPTIALRPLSETDAGDSLDMTGDAWAAHAVSGTRVRVEATPKMGARMPTVTARDADGRAVASPAQLVNALIGIILSPSFFHGMLALDGFLVDGNAFQAIDVVCVNSISTAPLPLRTRLGILASLSHFTNDLCQFVPAAHSPADTNQRVLYRHLDSRYMHADDPPWALVSANAQYRHVMQRLSACVPQTRVALVL